MKKIMLSITLCLFSVLLSAQFIYKIKADSVLITNDSCTAELNLENRTKDTIGFLFNRGKGRTEFRRMVKKIDSITYVIGGLDTIRTGGSSIANTIYTGDGTISGNRNLNFSSIGGGINFNLKTATSPSFTQYKTGSFQINPDWGGRVLSTYLQSDDDSGLVSFSVVNNGYVANRGNEIGFLITGTNNHVNFGGQTEGTFIRADRQPMTIIADNQGNSAASYPIQFYTGTNFFQNNTSSVPVLRLNGDQTIDIKSTLRFGNLSSDPTGSNGMLYYNNTNNKFRGYQNGAWVDLIGGGGGGTGSNLSWDATNHKVDIDGGGTSAVIPFATGSANGLVSTATQSFAGLKQFYTGIQQLSGTNFTSGGVALTNDWVAGAVQNFINGTLSNNMNGNSWNINTNQSWGTNVFTGAPLTEASSGTHNIIANTIFLPNTITNGSATSTYGATVYIGGSARGTAPTNNYSMWIDSGLVRIDETILMNNGSDSAATRAYARSVGAGSIKQAKAITLVSPTSSENATIFYTTQPITIEEVRGVMLGSSQSVTLTINYGSSRASATGTIVASNTFDSGDSGYQTTGFAFTLNTTSIPAGSYIWLTTSATSGTINDLNLTLTYRQ